MAAIKITINVPDIEDVIDLYDQIKVYRYTWTDDTPTELTDADTRIPLESGRSEYSFVDDSGHEDFWYATSYYHSLNLIESAKSALSHGEGDSALDILSITELKSSFLFGLDLTDENGNSMPNSLFEFYIKSAVSWLEMRLNAPLRKKYIEDERHDFIRDDYDKYMWMELDEFPVLSVSRVRLVLPGDQIVNDFDSTWIHVMKETGQVQIVPGTGVASTILLGASGAWIPYIYGTNRFIPEAFRVRYIAGFETNRLPALFKDLIGRIASYGPLAIAGELILGAGVASTSLGIDGLSQSISTMASPSGGAYSSRIKQYQEEVKELLPEAIRYFKGLRLQVV